MFLNIKIFILAVLFTFSFFSSADYCEEGFNFKRSKLYYAGRVFRSGIIEASRRLFPTFVDPKKERELVDKWNEKTPAPKLFKRYLPEGAYFIKYQQYQPGSPTAVKLGQPGNEIMVRASYEYGGRELHTNVVFSTRALLSNMRTKKNWFAGEDAKAVIIFLHGGGTKSTGAHVAAGQVTHFKKYNVDVVSLDLPWHGQGPREIMDLESEIGALAAFVQKYIPPHVPVIVKGHSWGSVLAEQLMTMTDRPKADFLFHENLTAILLFSTAVDPAPGESPQEKAEAYYKVLHDVNHNRQDEVPVAERNLWKNIPKDGKTSVIGGWYASGTIFQLDQSLPAHRGRKYVNTYVVVGAFDSLVYLGFEGPYNKRYSSLENVVDFNVLRELPYRYSKNTDDPPMRVGHLLGDYKTEDGTEANVQFALTRRYIQRELYQSTIREIKKLVIEQVEESSLDAQTRSLILTDLDRVSSIEDISWFIYTNVAVQKLESSSLQLIKRSILEKEERASLNTPSSISDTLRTLIRQQLELLSLDGYVKEGLAKRLDNKKLDKVSSIHDLKHWIRDMFRALVKQQLKLSSLDEYAKKDLNEELDKASSIQEIKQLIVDKLEHEDIKQFVTEWNPTFFDAINSLIHKREVEHTQSSADMAFINTVQNFANNLAFREYQKGYTYYEYGGNAARIGERNMEILEEIRQIVAPYYNPQMRAANVLAEILNFNDEAARQSDRIIRELESITSPENLRTLHNKGAQALIELREQMRNGLQLEEIAEKADDIMQMKTYKGDPVFDVNPGNGAEENHQSRKRVQAFINKVKVGRKFETEVKEMMEQLGLSPTDKAELIRLLEERYLNENVSLGYFTIRMEDILEDVHPDNRERVGTHYRSLMSINGEWRKLNDQKGHHNRMRKALLRRYAELLKKADMSIKKVKDVLDQALTLTPPDTLKDALQRLDRSAENLALAKEELDRILDENAAHVFHSNEQTRSLSDVSELFSEKIVYINEVLELYDLYVRNRTDFNKQAIEAMEYGDINTGSLKHIQSLKEAVNWLYGKGSKGKNPTLSEQNKRDIDKAVEEANAMRVVKAIEAAEVAKAAAEEAEGLAIAGTAEVAKKAVEEAKKAAEAAKVAENSKKMSELEEIEFRVREIEKISGYLAFEYLTVQLARLEMEEQNNEKFSKINRKQYIDEVEHLVNLTPEDTSIHRMLVLIHATFRPDETHIRDIISNPDIPLDNGGELLDYIHSNIGIFNNLIKKWESAKSSPLPPLPTVYNQ